MIMISRIIGLWHPAFNDVGIALHVSDTGIAFKLCGDTLSAK
jgi:hypothetical protein